MPQNPIPAYAYGQSPTRAAKLVQVDATGHVIPSATSLAGEGNAVTSAQALTLTASPGVTLFTIAGGPIEVISLFSIFTTAAGATATTIQYVSTPTLGATTQALNAACTTLSGVAAGTQVTLSFTSPATASAITLAGSTTVPISAQAESYYLQAGVLSIIVGGASNTGLLQTYLRYKPLANGVTVTPAF